MLKAKIINRRIEGKTVRLVLKTLDGKAARLKVADDGKWIIEGYASVFGNVDSYGEIVVRGAFTEWLKENLPRYPKMVWGHDWALPLGPTLEAREDDYGLFVRGELLPEVAKAVEVHALIKSGAITDLSFGFSVQQDEYDPKTGIRKLLKLAIYEWSPVLVGANSLAQLTGAKGAAEDVKADGDFTIEEEGGAGEEPKAAAKCEAEGCGKDLTEADGQDAKTCAECTAKAAAAASDDQGDKGAGGAPAADDVKEGRTLSSKTRRHLEGVRDAMTAVAETAKTATDAIDALLASADADDDGKGAQPLPAGEGVKVIKAMMRQAGKIDRLGRNLIKTRLVRDQ